MNLKRSGLTLMEIIIVLILIGVVAAIAFPNFTAPQEQARAQTAKNNLMAIYTAQQNYNNNNGSFCTTSLTPNPEPACAAANASCAPDLASINCNLSLNIQDDGTYTYSCTNASGFTCQAVRQNGPGALTITVTNAPIVQGTNPDCVGNTAWC